MENTKTPSLRKQLLGALAGGVIALLCYLAYEVAAEPVLAYLIPPGMQSTMLSGETAVADTNGNSEGERAERFRSRAEQIARVLNARTKTADAQDHAAAPEEHLPVEEVIPPAAVEREEEDGEAEQVVHSGAPNLPRSGWGSTLAVVFAMSYVGALLLKMRRVMRR